ncbi:MAG: glycosyltransferase [Flavobacteriales bacterium]|nr:glycosyltransferase [Flavobacteriales bacterium]
MHFPYGVGEAFLEHELPFLAERFDRVSLFPLEVLGPSRDLPAGVEVVGPVSRLYARAGLFRMMIHLPLLLRVRRIVRRDAPTPEVFRARWPEARSRFRQGLHRALALRKIFASRYDPERVVLYSYWTSDWATALGLWRYWYPKGWFVSRIMGFDLFADRSPDGWQVLQSFHLERARRVYAVSRSGLEHLRERHPRFADRLGLAYLGTADHGSAPWAPSPGPLRIVSCSNLFPLKRVTLLAKALALFEMEVEWTHFGDGPERDDLEREIARMPPNVRATLMGSVPNKHVISWYQEHPVDLFVHPSMSEGGVPVALMEAASFGVPMVACAVGGVPEIVLHGRTGVLLPAVIGPDGLAVALMDAMRLADGAMRDHARAHWNEHFCSEDVHAAWADELIRMR